MITVIDYGAGNLRSVCLALESINVPWTISADPKEISAAERVIFPGVGAAASAIKVLQEKGLEQAIKDYVASGKPFLGICLGTQIIFNFSEEDQGTECLGLIPGNVIHFDFPQDEKRSVPHMGWNQVNFSKPHPLFKDIENGSNFYFVHSYYPCPEDKTMAIASTDYGSISFTCAITKNNLIATQFHPEKSGRHGLQLLKNFSTWDGTNNAK
ncbi:imidazole glycerol phosphate synthase subunit HisH [Lentisphaera profundi]|uniref:Imidazole glycerol phosphate synthase subunit HisH n=1 Tax=Lentisphaera profundi TaxID=1658616 RepID=A0ABY7VRY9_9BACT|nr:imidazole glycerol phosphate synthase subunit HisH [Lentisphaera profundi]WDE95621.1 imidazole glycerol phosphate synthase subunit HisH [Lentisphaera profundi]